MSKKKAPVDALINHTVTEEDLELNPELELEGTKVGDVIQIEREDASDEDLEAERLVIEKVEEEKNKKDDDEDGTGEVNTEEEAYVGKIPSWARAEGVIPSKEDEDKFRTRTEDKPVNRDEKVPDYMIA